jgi:hypothetical protein
VLAPSAVEHATCHQPRRPLTADVPPFPRTRTSVSELRIALHAENPTRSHPCDHIVVADWRCRCDGLQLLQLLSLLLLRFLILIVEVGAERATLPLWMLYISFHLKQAFHIFSYLIPYHIVSYQNIRPQNRQRTFLPRYQISLSFYSILKSRPAW